MRLSLEEGKPVGGEEPKAEGGRREEAEEVRACAGPADVLEGF